eukprot:PhM_4_TR1915/c0_g1_i1/m.98616
MTNHTFCQEQRRATTFLDVLFFFSRNDAFTGIYIIRVLRPIVATVHNETHLARGLLKTRRARARAPRRHRVPHSRQVGAGPLRHPRHIPLQLPRRGTVLVQDVLRAVEIQHGDVAEDAAAGHAAAVDGEVSPRPLHGQLRTAAGRRRAAIHGLDLLKRTHRQIHLVQVVAVFTVEAAEDIQSVRGLVEHVRVEAAGTRQRAPSVDPQPPPHPNVQAEHKVGVGAVLRSEDHGAVGRHVPRCSAVVVAVGAGVAGVQPAGLVLRPPHDPRVKNIDFASEVVRRVPREVDDELLALAGVVPDGRRQVRRGRRGVAAHDALVPMHVVEVEDVQVGLVEAGVVAAPCDVHAGADHAAEGPGSGWRGVTGAMIEIPLHCELGAFCFGSNKVQKL